jgi:uncharacterized membrane protein HdeD (DUF308 family)/uncharacterized membrane protein YjdF
MSRVDHVKRSPTLASPHPPERMAPRPATEPSGRRWDRRRLVYGDWSWFIRDPLDLLRIGFIAGTIAFALMGRSTAVGLTAACVLLLVARIIDLPRRFDLGLIVAMTLIAWGTALTLYGDYYVYDNIVHSLSPFFYAPVIYIALVRLGVLADPEETRSVRNHVGVFVSTLAIGMAVGAGYEVIEWLSDSLLGTHFVQSIDDTGSDLLEDTLGSLAGAAFLAVWSIRHWSSRRIPVGTVASPHRSPLQTASRLPVGHRQQVAAWRSTAAGLPLAAKGAVGIVGGILLLVWPTPTLRTVEVVIAVAVLAHAAFDALELVRRADSAGVVGRLAEVIAETAIGVILLARPEMSRLALLYALGAWAVILAFLETASLSASERSGRDRWLGGAISAAAFVFGVALLGLPHRSFDAMLTALGLYLLVLGTLRLIRALAPGTAKSIGPSPRQASSARRRSRA